MWSGLAISSRQAWEPAEDTETLALQGQVQGGALQQGEPLRTPGLSPPMTKQQLWEPDQREHAGPYAQPCPGLLRQQGRVLERQHACWRVIMSLVNAIQTPSGPTRKHLPPCSQRPIAFLRGDSWGGVKGGRGRREQPLVLRSPSPHLGAPARLGALTARWPRGARGSQCLPAPPDCAAPAPGRRPQTRAGPLRGGASGFKSQRCRTRAVERAEEECGPSVERAGGTREAGLPRGNPRHLRGARPGAAKARVGARGWGAQYACGGPRAPSCGSASVPPERSELRAGRCDPGLRPPSPGGSPCAGVRVRRLRYPVWAWEARGGGSRPPSGFPAGRVRLSGRGPAGPVACCPPSRAGVGASAAGAGHAPRG